MKILDWTEKKKHNYLGHYLLAAIGGVLLFVVILFLFKGIVIVAKFVFAHWLLFGGVIVGLLVLRKLLRNKKKTVIIEK